MCFQESYSLGNLIILMQYLNPMTSLFWFILVYSRMLDFYFQRWYLLLLYGSLQMNFSAKILILKRCFLRPQRLVINPFIVINYFALSFKTSLAIFLEGYTKSNLLVYYYYYLLSRFISYVSLSHLLMNVIFYQFLGEAGTGTGPIKSWSAFLLTSYSALSLSVMPFVVFFQSNHVL